MTFDSYYWTVLNFSKKHKSYFVLNLISVSFNRFNDFWQLLLDFTKF